MTFLSYERTHTRSLLKTLKAAKSLFKSTSNTLSCDFESRSSLLSKPFSLCFLRIFVLDMLPIDVKEEKRLTHDQIFETRGKDCKSEDAEVRKGENHSQDKKRITSRIEEEDEKTIEQRMR